MVWLPNEARYGAVKLYTDINIPSLIPHEDKNFGGSLVLDFSRRLVKTIHSKKYFRWRFSFPVFWCTKSVKFHFRWGTKPRDQKHETGNDSDVISGLQASQKNRFLQHSYFVLNNALLYHFSANGLAHNKKMTKKSVFREAWSPEMTSQSFPVSCFWSCGFVPHRKWNLTLLVHQNTGKENRYRIIFFAIHISSLRRFNRANKKIRHIHFNSLCFIWNIYLFLVSPISTTVIDSKSKAYRSVCHLILLWTLV